MKRRAFVASSVASLTILGCGGQPQKSRVDRIVVEKGKRKMTLFANGKAVKTYNIGLGWNPVGHKRFEGDGKTPEGLYRIYTKNPRSAFYLSLGVSYPNRQDYNFARSYGRSPGGDIFIHGESRDPRVMNKRDWTAGCIAVKNSEILEIYKLVGVGTIIDIKA